MPESLGEPVVLSWSGGKDSAMALRSLQEQGANVVALLTTVTEDYERISIHGVRRELLAAQAAALELPVVEARIPTRASDEIYQEAFLSALEPFRDRGVRSVAFGDLFLEDVRHYREELLQRGGMEGLFPIWGRDTAELARDCIAQGFKATTVCVDTEQLAGEFVGLEYSRGFLSRLPASVDPCGERGEFHTFVWDGPNFARPVAFTVGETVLRDARFNYCDLLPA